MPVAFFQKPLNPKHMNPQTVLKYLSAYLAFKPRLKYQNWNKLDYLEPENFAFYSKAKDFKLVLRPLSDLFITIKHEHESFLPLLELQQWADTDYERHFLDNIEQIIKERKIEYMPFTLFQKLLEWHFDVFGLIEKGLAIDINTIK